jgi:protein phosphatase 1 regulatory subunit 11
MVVHQEEEQKGQEPSIIRFTLNKPKPEGGIRWAEDTVDNEHMNKKKSKSISLFLLILIVCCIYAKPVKHPDEESSSEESSCCDSDKDDERNNYDRPPKHMRKHEKDHKHQCDDSHHQHQ